MGMYKDIIEESYLMPIGKIALAINIVNIGTFLYKYIDDNKQVKIRNDQTGRLSKPCIKGNVGDKDIIKFIQDDFEMTTKNNVLYIKPKAKINTYSLISTKSNRVLKTFNAKDIIKGRTPFKVVWEK